MRDQRERTFPGLKHRYTPPKDRPGDPCDRCGIAFKEHPGIKGTPVASGFDSPEKRVARGEPAAH